MELSDNVEVRSVHGSVDDFKWQLEYPTAATEALTFYLTTDSGLYVLVQMVYSTMGLSPSVQTTCRIYGPNNSKFAQTLTPATESFFVSTDRLSVTCAPFSITHDSATRGYTVRARFDADTSVDATFLPPRAEGEYVRLNEGKALFHETEVEGYIEAAFMPKAHVEGNVVFQGTRFDASGEGMALHVVTCQPQCVARYNFVNFQSHDAAVLLYEFEMPQDGVYKTRRFSLGLAVHNGALSAVTTRNRALHVQTEVDEDFSGYAIPTQLFCLWNGKTMKKGEDARMEMSLMLTNLVDKIDVLAELPYLLRVFIQTFITAPFLYQWLEDVTINVVMGKESFELKGKAFIECSFLSS
ncbi:oxidative stress survival, Svf1-like protein [Chytriomyces sp. MP71]|nr:oxidative stress survival, Svf1-like protein [Chytriomyces sp. MP71]